MTDLTREELARIIHDWIRDKAPFNVKATWSPKTWAMLTDAILARLPPVEQIRAEARKAALEEAAQWHDLEAEKARGVAANYPPGHGQRVFYIGEATRHEMNAISIRALTSHTPKEEKA